MLPVSRETCMQVKKQQLEPDMEQLTHSKVGKKYDEAVYCHLAYLTYIQSRSEVTQLCPTHCDPMDCIVHGTLPWNSPGQNTGVGSHSLLQGIFPTQESNPGLRHCRKILYLYFWAFLVAQQVRKRQRMLKLLHNCTHLTR